MLLFSPYEDAMNEFYRAGGTRVSAIRSPVEVLRAFKRTFPEETAVELRYLGAPVEPVATQDYVSVLGSSIAGHTFEWPKPD